MDTDDQLETERSADGEIHRQVLSSQWLQQIHRPGPWLVLGLSMAISAFAGFVTDIEVQAKQESRFEHQAEQLQAAIDSRMQAYRSLLQAGVGMFNASDKVTREEWRLFHRSLNIESLYPGIQGYGYAEFIRPEQLDAYEAEIRAEGFHNFQVYPQGARSVYTAIRFLEPFDWRNQRAFGYDMFSDPVRREAMAQAMDEGTATVSGRVTLVQETQVDLQPGFLMYLPRYRKGAPTETVEQRRAAILGFVYSPFRTHDLMEGILANELSYVSFRLYDQQVEPSRLMYDSGANRDEARDAEFVTRRMLQMGGRQWLIEIESTPAFETSADHYVSLLVFGAGCIDSLLLFIMSLAFLATRSEARQIEQSLAKVSEAERRYRVLLDAMPTGLVAANSSGKIVQVNEQAAELFHYPKSEMVGLKVEALLPLQYRQAHRGYRASYFEHPSKRLMGGGRELFAVTREGEEVPVEIGLSPMETESGTLTLATIVDVRERTRAREELHQLMDRLTQKNKEMEQFVYTVSHDLKAPLVTIAGFSAKLKDSLGEHLQQRQVHWLDRIEANVQSMEILLADLLELSRIIHRPADMQLIDIEEVLETTISNLGGAVQESEARIEIVRPLPKVVGQEQLLVECFQNLLSNAIKYHRDEVAPRIKISGSASDKQVCFEVADNGVGIDPRYHQRIFQIFERLEPERTEGTGVGLSIVKTIMEKHGGTVALDSQVGAGAVFTLCFPRQQLDSEEEGQETVTGDD